MLGRHSQGSGSSLGKDSGSESLADTVCVLGGGYHIPGMQGIRPFSFNPFTLQRRVTISSGGALCFTVHVPMS